MYDQGVVIGRVIGVEEGGPQSRLLIVEDKARPQYPNKIACEFYQGQRQLLEGIRNGQLVRVVGSIKSRLYKDRWYTSFSCFQVVDLSGYDIRNEDVRPVKGAVPDEEIEDDSSSEDLSSDPGF